MDSAALKQSGWIPETPGALGTGSLISSVCPACQVWGPHEWDPKAPPRLNPMRSWKEVAEAGGTEAFLAGFTLLNTGG